MTTNPHLPNHLIHELMHTICFKKSGDAMVQLALSGKEPFSVFQYIIENRAHAYTDCGDIALLCSSPYTSPSVSLKYRTEGSKHLTVRFVQNLLVDSPLSKDLHFEKIIDLTIRRYAKPFTSLLDSWTDLEVLKMCDITDAASDDFFDDFVNTSLPNLRKLDIGLTLKGCIKLMALIPRIPLPEEVIFHISIKSHALLNLGSLQTFSNVKRFVANIQVWTQMTSPLLHLLSSIINSFPSLETAKIAFTYTHDAFPNDFANVASFHEWLCNTKFSAAIEISCEELVDVTNIDNVIDVYNKLKSIGYEECGAAFYLVTKKEYGNVKLVHRIQHYDDSSDDDQLLADLIQNYLYGSDNGDYDDDDSEDSSDD
uniref:F-box domain-containing protein n=1 Tax=Panagrellus redivivus TaxID=6233 RepID=A0A7E4ZRJ2_PANRE